MDNIIQSEEKDENNKEVRLKIMKLFLETKREEFINLISTLDNKNFGLLQNELSQIIKDLENSNNKKDKKVKTIVFENTQLKEDNKDLRSQFIKYCFPKIFTARFSDLELEDGKINFNILNRWQLIDKNNSKCIKMDCENLVNEWNEIFVSKPYITIMHETINKKQRVFILNQATIDDGENDITIKYEKGMVQQEKNKPLTDIDGEYKVNKGIICIHTQ